MLRVCTLQIQIDLLPLVEKQTLGQEFSLHLAQPYGTVPYEACANT